MAYFRHVFHEVVVSHNISECLCIVEKMQCYCAPLGCHLLIVFTFPGRGHCKWLEIPGRRGSFPCLPTASVRPLSKVGEKQGTKWLLYIILRTATNRHRLAWFLLSFNTITKWSTVCQFIHHKTHTFWCIAMGFWPRRIYYLYIQLIPIRLLTPGTTTFDSDFRNKTWHLHSPA